MANLKKIEEGLDTITILMNVLQTEVTALQKTVKELHSKENGHYVETNNPPVSIGSSSNSSDTDEDEVDIDCLVVYTSAGITNGPAGPQVGIGVWFGKKHPDNISMRCLEKQTRSAAAIYACIEACKVAKAKSIRKMKINTDFDYVPNCMTNLIHDWKQNGWKKKDGTQISNKVDLLILEHWSKELASVTYAVVNEGQGIEAAKALAAEGAKMKKLP